MGQQENRHPGGIPKLGKFWTAANVLSLARMALVVPLAYLILVDGPILWILGLCILAIATDYFDGRLARWSHTVSDWGKVLDPLADKVGGGMVILALVIRGSLPIWLIVLVLLRDVLIVLGGIVLSRRTGQIAMSLWSGKVAITALSITALAALLKADSPVLLFCIYTSAVLLVYSFIHYMGRYSMMVRAAQTMARLDEPEPDLDEIHKMEQEAKPFR